MGAIFGAISEKNSDYINIKDKLVNGLNFRYNDTPKIIQNEGFFVGAGGWSQHDFYISNKRNKYIAFEGEIYNCKDLFKQLFPDENDSMAVDELSIILLLYDKFGYDFPRYLNGVYAIGIWDKEKRELILCRDHVGSHSLYYSIVANTILFSSTIKSLIATGLISTQISVASVNQYFSSKALTPPSTMYSSIAALKPSHVIIIKDNVITEHDYWNLNNIEIDEKSSISDHIYHLHELISDSIKIRADYPGRYGTIVSGGVDTGIVTATLARIPRQNPLKAFSISFDESAFSDTPLQKLMVSEFALQHIQEVLGPDEFINVLCDAIGYLDSPLNDIAFVGMAKAFEVAKRNGCSVVFEGEGPDEIFPAGNTQGERQIARFLHIPEVIRRNFLRLLFHTMPLGDSFWNKISRSLTRIAMDDDERRLTWRTYFHNNLRKKLLTFDWYDPSDPYINQKKYLKLYKNNDTLNCYQFGIIKTFLPDNLLFKDERMAARSGIINRVPLVDFRLVELALKIPSRLQLEKPRKNTDGIKLLYKKALKGQVPNPILMHKKVRGFSQPTSIWYRDELKEFVYETLLGSNTMIRGIINPQYINTLVCDHFSGRANYDYPINSLLIFELWMKYNHDKLHFA